MNARERVFATLAGEPVDRRAFSVPMSLYGARLIDCPLRHYYTDSVAYAEGQAAVWETFHPDMLFAPFVLAGEGEAFGGQLRYFDDQAPNLQRPAFRSVEQIRPGQYPDVDAHPRLLHSREALRLMKKAHGCEVPLAGILLSPVDLPLMLMGIEGWLQTVLFDREGTRRMLDLTVPFVLQWARALRADGADLLAMPVAFLNPAVVTREIVEEIALPILREAFAEIACPIVLHHTGAPFLDFLEFYRDLPHVVGFVMDHRDSLGESRTRLQNGVTLIGGLDGPNLGKLSIPAIEVRCHELLEDRRDDRNYILGSSGADIAWDTPAGNVRAIARAAEAFGEGKADGRG